MIAHTDGPLVYYTSPPYSGYSVYNLAVYGTCDLQNPDECVFTNGGSIPTAANCECDFPLDNCTKADFEFCNTDCTCLGVACLLP